MRAGLLRHKLTIQESTPGEYGAASTYRTWAKPCGSIEPLTGKTAEVAHATYPTVTHKITVRYIAGLCPSPKHRFYFEGRIFGINGITDELERHRQLVALCTEVGAV